MNKNEFLNFINRKTGNILKSVRQKKFGGIPTFMVDVCVNNQPYIGFIKSNKATYSVYNALKIIEEISTYGQISIKSDFDIGTPIYWFNFFDKSTFKIEKGKILSSCIWIDSPPFIQYYVTADDKKCGWLEGALIGRDRIYTTRLEAENTRTQIIEQLRF